MHSVSVSPDFTVLKCKEGNRWSHTLTLKKKYEAGHEGIDLAKGEGVGDTADIQAHQGDR